MEPQLSPEERQQWQLCIEKANRFNIWCHCHKYGIIELLLKRRLFSMTTLSEIEAAIKQLPEQDIRQLVARLQDYLDEVWDQQIEADLGSGKLDTLIAQAEADIAASRVKDLDEVLRNF